MSLDRTSTFFLFFVLDEASHGLHWLVPTKSWKPEFIDPLSRGACFREKIEESEDDSDSEWEPDGDSDDCSEPESDDDGNAFDAFNDGLWLVISKKMSILLECFNCPNCPFRKVSRGLQS